MRSDPKSLETFFGRIRLNAAKSFSKSTLVEAGADASKGLLRLPLSVFLELCVAERWHVLKRSEELAKTFAISVDDATSGTSDTSQTQVIKESGLASEDKQQ